MRHRRASVRLFGPFALLAGLMICALIGFMFAGTNEMDSVRRKREQVQVHNGFNRHVRELRAVVSPQVIWDEAVAKLDNHFDPQWAKANIGDVLAKEGFELVYVLDGFNTPVYSAENGRTPGVYGYAVYAKAIAPLIAAVRQAEAARGPYRDRAHTRAMISAPIQASAVKATPAGIYILTASLVQPDFGAALPAGATSPIVVSGEAIDEAFLKTLDRRSFLNAPIRLTSVENTGGSASTVLIDEHGRPVAAFAWRAEKPGAKLLLNLLGPISLVIFAFGAVSMFMLMKVGKTTRALIDSEARLAMALGAAHAGAFEIDFTSKAFWSSPELAELFGRELSYDEVCTWPWAVVHPEDSGVFKPRETGDEIPDGPRDPFEVRIVLPDGEIRWCRFYGEATREPGGPPTHITGLVLNIDERKRQELALIDAQAAAQAAAEAKSQFLASVSHEIRTPMNGVVGVLHLLKTETLSDGGRRLLGEALACSQMLTALVDDVLDFSRIEADRLELNAEPTDPAEVLGGVANLLRPQAEAKGVSLSVAMQGQIGPVLADPIRLRQCLFNLVGNAVKFTGKGSVAVSVRRVVGETGPRLRFEVADTGIGIAPEAQTALFQRFQQADSSTTRRYGGAGLGLAITKRLAEMMGGSVGLSSREGEGSVFWLEIAAPDAALAAPSAETEPQGLDGMRILVVEDNATNRLIVTKILERLGAVIETASDGETGVAAARQGNFDLILMDIQMPGIDGMEAARQIRGQGGLHMPIIALTANVLDGQKATYLAAGMNGVVSKPITPSALLNEIIRCATEETDVPEAMAS